MPITDHLPILKCQDLDHIISCNFLSRSFRSVFYCINSTILLYIDHYTIRIFPDLRMILSIYFSLAFKIVEIKNSSWKNTADYLFLFPIQIRFINTAVPFSICSLFHISAEKNGIIHNAVTLYTIICSCNSFASRRTPPYKLHLWSCSLKFVRTAICSNRIFLYITDLTIFINLVYTIFYDNTCASSRCYRLSKCIYKITCISFDFYLISTFRKFCLRTGSGCMDLPLLGIINSFIQYKISVYIFSNDLFCILSRYHTNQHITPFLLLFWKRRSFAFCHLWEIIHIVSISS